MIKFLVVFSATNNGNVTLKIDVNRRDVQIGEDVNVSCIVEGIANGKAVWSKLGDSFESNVRVEASMLRFDLLLRLNLSSHIL